MRWKHSGRAMAADKVADAGYVLDVGGPTPGESLAKGLKFQKPFWGLL